MTVITNFNKQKNAPPPKEKSIVFEKLFTRFLKEHRLADTPKRQMLVVMRAVMRFELYKQKSGNKSFRFNVKTLTNATMKEFWNFLKNEHSISADYPELYKEVEDCQSVISQRSNNTLVGFINRLKVFFSWCIDEGLHTIYNCGLSDAPHLDRQRDIFVFQCCIGCRVGDLVRLTKADVINGAIECIASKTIEENQKTILVPLNKTALAILEKFKDY